MSNHNHTGTVWSNATSGVHRRSGPGTTFPINKTLPAGTPLIVLCYSQGEEQSFTASDGHVYTNTAWDFVIIDDQDPGGYVADVYVDTGGDITHQLGVQGTCTRLSQTLAGPSGLG